MDPPPRPGATPLEHRRRAAGKRGFLSRLVDGNLYEVVVVGRALCLCTVAGHYGPLTWCY